MTGAPTSPVSMSGLNEDLDTNALDLDPTDQGLLSTIIRLIAGAVGKCCRPRQILVILRLLKAVTFCFLILTVCADLMYLIFVEFLSSDATGNALGGVRDTIVRIYGVALAVLAILIELDITAAVRHFSGLKAFVPRGLLLFLLLRLRTQVYSSSAKPPVQIIMVAITMTMHMAVAMMQMREMIT